LVFSHIFPYPTAPDAAAYYTALEMSLKSKDEGSEEFQKVLEGKAAAIPQRTSNAASSCAAAV
jgi:hypothetical protein